MAATLPAAPVAVNVNEPRPVTLAFTVFNPGIWPNVKFAKALPSAFVNVPPGSNALWSIGG